MSMLELQDAEREFADASDALLQGLASNAPYPELAALGRRKLQADTALRKLQETEVPPRHVGQLDAGALADRKERAVHESTAHTCVCEDVGMPTIEYLSLQGVADHLRLSRNTVAKYKLPEPDAVLRGGKDARGWLVSTIDKWHANRPGSPGRPREVAAELSAAELQARTAELRASRAAAQR